MSIKAILFDLDGTLLPMNQDEFLKMYFKAITEFVCCAGEHEPQSFMKAMWRGISAMQNNDGKNTNDVIFFTELEKEFGAYRVEKDIQLFDRFYHEKFASVKEACAFSPYSRKIIDFLKTKDVKIILATQPVYPKIATDTRMSWGGIYPSDFDLVTYYDNIGYCKPNVEYYGEIANRIGALPSECLMVGNDTRDDLSCKELGMDIYLITDCLINEKHIDISEYKNSSLENFYNYLQKNL